MQNENYSYEDLNSWFTHPRVETSQPFDRFSTDSILPELEGFGVPGPSEFYYGTFSGMASDGSWRSFDSSPGATAFNANYSQLLPSSGTHSPPHSMISSLPPTPRSTLLEQRSSYRWDSALPPSLTLPTMSYQEDGLIHYRATPTFSTGSWMLDNELVSSPIPFTQDLPPLPEEAGVQPPTAYSFSVSPGLETLPLALDESTSPPSREVNSPVVTPVSMLSFGIRRFSHSRGIIGDVAAAASAAEIPLAVTDARFFSGSNRLRGWI